MKTHWFPSIRPAIKPLFSGGGGAYVTGGGGRSTTRMYQEVSKWLVNGL